MLRLTDVLINLLIIYFANCELKFINYLSLKNALSRGLIVGRGELTLRGTIELRF
jgi:hypothetical protein